MKVNRETLRLKMLQHQDAAAKLRKQIEKIDKEAKKEENAKFLNKCFRLNAGTKDNPSWHGYARVEFFDSTNLEPHGTHLDIYDQFEYENNKVYMQVELNHSFFMDWIKNGEKISNKKFELMLKRITNEIGNS